MSLSCIMLPPPRKKPDIPPFHQQKSASTSILPDLNLPRPVPIPTRKKRGFTATLRKSAHVSLVELRRAFKPQAILYIIYNITMSEALQFSKKKGLTVNQINWIHIRMFLPKWRATDQIWAMGTDGSEHSCSKQVIGEHPSWGLIKSSMPGRVRDQFHVTTYKTFYYEQLLKTPIRSTTTEGWIVLKHPITGAIIDVI